MSQASIAMSTVTAFEAEVHFGKILDRVAGGEKVVITRHDKPVARLIPEGRRSAGDVRSAVNGLLALQKQIAARSHGKQELTDLEVRSAIEAGRR